MKKISEQTKNFLLYGIEDVIKPKEIYKIRWSNFVSVIFILLSV